MDCGIESGLSPDSLCRQQEGKEMTIGIMSQYSRYNLAAASISYDFSIFFFLRNCYKWHCRGVTGTVYRAYKLFIFFIKTSLMLTK